jgi:hypothetical protein
MSFSPRTHTGDVQYRDRTYGLSLHGGRTHLSPNVWSLCGRKTLFSPIHLVAHVFLDLRLF